MLAGIAVVLLFALHGAVFLSLRTLGDLRARSMRTAARLAPIAAVVGAGFLVWTLVVASDRNDKSVFPGILPVAVAAVAVVAAIFLTRSRSEKPAFLATGLAIVAVVVTLFVSLYPRVMVSQPDFANSLTVSNASSQHYTLTVMTVAAAILLPVVLLYQAWTYHVFRARIGGEDVGTPGRPRRADAGRPLAMRALDPRLLGRARAVRRLLVADAALGLFAALLVLAQAVLIARVAARGFGGASLGEVAAPLALLVAVVAARGAAAWGFEVVGRRAAADVLSRLRLDLVARRLRDDPASLDGADSAEVATAAVSGVDALEASFARLLPQLVLAVIVPVAVIVLVAWLDPLSAGLMLLTLPLVPVFMWLVGRHTERRTQERWEALALLSTHFLDVVRGLPTLRAFNRAEAQADEVERVSDRYRRATMGTLRVAFLSGAVLELAATVGVALVAVTVGVRLVNGGLGLETALTVLVLAPELYAPLRSLAAQYHASADGHAVAGRILDLLEAPVAVRSGTLCHRGRGTRRSGSRRSRSPTRRGRSPSSRGRPRARPRARRSRSSARAGWGSRRSPRSSCGWPSRLRAGSRPAASIWRRAMRRPGARGSPGCRSGRRSSAAPWPMRSGSAIPTPPARGSRRPRASPAPTRSCASCRTATRRWSVTAVARSPRARRAGSRSRAHSSATPTCSCSTSRPRISIPPRPRPSARRSRASPRGGRCS